MQQLTSIWAELQSLVRRARGSAMLYGAGGAIVRVGGNVLLLPLIIKSLSTADLALWWIFLALGGLANLADFGFGQAISRVYGYFWAGVDDFDTVGLGPPPKSQNPNLPSLRQLASTSRLLYTRLAVAATLVLAGAGSAFLLSKLNSPSLWLTWIAYFLVVGYCLGSSHWMFACLGTNRVRELQSSNLWSGLIYIASAGILLTAGCGLISMVVATALRGIASREICARAFHQAVPNDLSETRSKPNLSMLQRLWPNAWRFGILSIGVYFINNSGVLICSHFLGDETTATYGLTAQIGTFLANFSALWLAVKWPQITILRTQGRLTDMSMLFARRLALMMVTFVLLSVALILIGNQLLEWKGGNTRLLSASYLTVYLLYLAQQQFYAQFGMLTFTENVVPFYKISLYTGIGMALLSVVMTAWFELWGLILAPLIATLVCSSWYPVRRGFQGQPLSVRQFMRAALTGRI